MWLLGSEHVVCSGKTDHNSPVSHSICFAIGNPRPWNRGCLPRYACPPFLCEHSSFPLFPWWRLPLSATFVDARVGERAPVGPNARRRGNNKKKTRELQSKSRGNFDPFPRHAGQLVLHMAPYTARAEVIMANYPENSLLQIPPVEKFNVP